MVHPKEALWIGDILTLEDTELEWTLKGIDIFVQPIQEVPSNIGVLLDIGEFEPSFLIGKRLLKVDRT
ncbi:hypothetical protein [Risungbinella massiliensis]|uniref:hypothetical protein n=1 Tax=Risungbinella massiliensis TaxID=1329796 RepID=UPI0005CC53EE|nr:hypothetical protein [Risungbinella massiliensis]